MWVQRDFPLLPPYVEKVKRLFGIPGVFPQNFSGNPETARRTINDWVEAQTRKKITDLLAKGTIQPDTRLVLTNAVYFKAAWDNPFPQSPDPRSAVRHSGTVDLHHRAALRK